MKIAYIYTALTTTGGVDRILSVKANYFAEKMDYEVSIITDSQAGRPIIFPLSDKVKHIDLDINFGMQYKYGMFLRFFFYKYLMKKYKTRLKKAILDLKPDIILSTCGRDMDFITSIHNKCIVIGESHISRNFVRNFHLIEKKGFPYNYVAKYWRKKQDNAVKKLDAFVVLTKEDAQSWSTVRKSMIIPNPLTFMPENRSNYKSKRIISVGRLNEQKGYDLLIKAWALISNRHKEWEINIYGNGELKDYLNDLIKEYHIMDSFHINTPSYNIEEKYCESSIYVMPSRFEGFGLVLTEAMSCGLPCISFDCPYGPSGIIKDGIDGFLIKSNDIDSLANKIEYLIDNEDIRKKMGEQAQINISRYRPDVIMKSWSNLFELFKPE